MKTASSVGGRVRSQQHGPRQAETAVPALAEALKDKNKTVRVAAAQALRRYGRQAKAAVKTLAQAVTDAEPQVRLAAIKALAAIGPEARPGAQRWSRC